MARGSLIANSDFEVDVSGWVIAGAVSIARDTGQFKNGVASMLITCDSASDTAQAPTVTSGFKNGSRLIMNGWIRGDSIFTGRIGFNELGFTGNYLRTTVASQGSIAANTWTFLTLDTFVGFDCYQLQPFIGNGTTFATSVWVDDVNIWTSTTDVGWWKA
jgi:hypothetical protein